MDRLQQKEEGQMTGEYLDDAEVTAKVKGKFITQKGLDSLDIKVVTVDGTVTLMAMWMTRPRSDWLKTWPGKLKA